MTRSIVLIHAVRSSRTMWKGQTRRLRERGYTVIAPDLPGHGRRRGEPFTLEAALATIDEAVAMANGLDVGLGASVWSSDKDAAREVAARIEAGTVWINRHGAVDPRVPFGGAKQSGYGLEFGVEGLKALGAPQVISG